MAVTTAIASGVKLPTSREVATAAPKAIETQNTLLSIIDECLATQIVCHQSYDGPVTYEVEYIHCPGSKKTEETLMIDGYTKHMKPVSVHFTQMVGELSRLTVEWA
jgi:hypothetical protein